MESPARWRTSRRGVDVRVMTSSIPGHDTHVKRCVPSQSSSPLDDNQVMTRAAPREGDVADTELARRLREGRAATGLNQREMAQELGISPSELSRYERAVIRPDLPRLIALCERYSLDEAEMVRLRAKTPGSGRGRRQKDTSADDSKPPADAESAATEVGRAVETTIAERRPTAPGQRRLRGSGQ